MSQHDQNFQGVKVTHPESNDILCGKDKQCVAHVGSVRFRSIIESYRQRYASSLTKFDKMQITKEIYETLSQSSRFLKYNTKEKVWEEISPMAARDKCGHALRFANRNKSKGKNALGMRVAPETASLLTTKSGPSLSTATVVSASNSANSLRSSSSSGTAPAASTGAARTPSLSTIQSLQLLQQQAAQATIPPLQLTQQQHHDAAVAALKRYDSLVKSAGAVSAVLGAAAAAAAPAPPSVVSIPSLNQPTTTTASLLSTVLQQHQEQQQQQQQRQPIQPPPPPPPPVMATAAAAVGAAAAPAHHRKRSTLDDLCSILSVVDPSVRHILGGN